MIDGYCPNGHRINGTLENLRARADIVGFFTTPEGVTDHEHEGWTEIFWDEERTVQRDGQDLYLCEDGEGEFTISELTFRAQPDD